MTVIAMTPPCRAAKQECAKPATSKPIKGVVKRVLRASRATMGISVSPVPRMRNAMDRQGNVSKMPVFSVIRTMIPAAQVIHPFA